MNLITVQRARKKAQEADEHYRWVIAEVFLPGDEVEVSRGRSCFTAEVVAPWPDSHPGVCTSGNRVWVRGKNGKHYDVHADRIVAHRTTGHSSK